MLAIDNNQIDNSKLLNRLVPKKRNEMTLCKSVLHIYLKFIQRLLQRLLTKLNSVLFRDDREGFLLELARDNTQLLINSIWGLPTERVEEVVVAKFPPPTFILPREKPVPVPKPLTKWEKYAKDKGNLKLLATYLWCRGIYFLKKVLISPNLKNLFSPNVKYDKINRVLIKKNLRKNCKNCLFYPIFHFFVSQIIPSPPHRVGLILKNINPCPLQLILTVSPFF